MNLRQIKGIGMTPFCQFAATALALVVLSASGAARAQDIGYHSGALNVALHGAVSVQEGVVEGAQKDLGAKNTNLDGYLRLVGDWTSDQGWLVGANLETSTRRTTQSLKSGEAYVYFSSELGRVEVGRQYGAANSLSFHAPDIALGQIRGDFARYAGTQALLSPFDSADSPKVIYLSPPVDGFRFGASWAPRDSSNLAAPDPRDRTLQRDVIELGAQYQRPVGDWVLGASTGYVSGRADKTTERQDIGSWSLGLDARRGPLRLGAAYVDRGDSNVFARGFNQREVNAGAAWVEDRWGLSVSASSSTGSAYYNRLAGAGGYYALTNHFTLRGDLVAFDEHDGGLPRRRGVTLVSEIEAHF
jgi:porin-like protein